MFQLRHLSKTIALLLAPICALAHPGHADDQPFVHALSHNLGYLVIMLAIGIVTTQFLERVRQVFKARKRSRAP